MSDFEYAVTDPATRQRMAPYWEHAVNTSRTHGIDPAFTLGLIAGESGGVPNARGDNGVAKGILQVQDRWVGNWMGNGPDVRDDPHAAITAIAPALARLSQRYGGDPLAMQVAYMRGDKLAKRISAGESPDQVFKKGDSAMARRHQMFKDIEARGKLKAAQPAANTPPTPEPYVPTPWFGAQAPAGDGSAYALVPHTGDTSFATAYAAMQEDAANQAADAQMAATMGLDLSLG